MASSPTVRSVRLFRNGRSQAIRIPREFALPGNEATISKDNKGRLVVEAVKPLSLTELLQSWDPLEKGDRLPEIEDLVAEPVDL